MCKTDKPVSEFWKNKARTDGLYRICKVCGMIARKERRNVKIPNVIINEGRFPDERNMGIINQAIAKCNHLIHTRDIVSEIVGIPLYTPAFHSIDPKKRRLLARLVSDYMKPRYPIYSVNSRGITWMVK